MAAGWAGARGLLDEVGAEDVELDEHPSRQASADNALQKATHPMGEDMRKLLSMKALEFRRI
jgi:hypothetical protein